MRTSNIQNLLSIGIYLVSALIGVTAFIYPFLLPVLAESGNDAFQARASVAPLLTLVLLGICLIVLILEVQGQAVSAKILASLGVMVAATATLRFLEVAIPGPGGFSPIFAPIILGGYVFGPRFGFLLGTMTLVVSALFTGSVGPWLPYQMFAAGWIGLTAGWLPHFSKPRLELAVLVTVGIFWGIAYGFIMNLYFWPFMTGNGTMGWESGLSWGQTAVHYLSFYVTTSLIWDLARAVGNGVLLAALGIPAIRALSRFKERFQFQVQSA